MDLESSREKHFDARALTPKVLLLSILVLAIYMMSPNLVSSGIGYDEGVYLTISREILGGKVLYRDLFDNKTPCMHYVTALLFAVLGSSVLAPRLVSLLLTLSSCVLVYCIGKRVFSEEVGLVSAFLFSIDPQVVLFARHVYTEVWGVFFGLSAVLVAVKYHGRRSAVVSGILVGVAFLINQIFLVVAIGCLGFFAYRWMTATRSTQVETALETVHFLAGGVLICLPVVAFFWMNHALPDLLFSVLTYNTLENGGLWMMTQRFFSSRVWQLVDGADLFKAIWYLGPLAIPLFLLKRGKPRSFSLVLIWFITGYFFIHSMAHELSHHLLIVVGPLSLMTGYVLEGIVFRPLARLRSAPGWFLRPTRVGSLAVALACCLCFSLLTVQAISNTVRYAGDTWGGLETDLRLAKHIQAVSQKDDLLLAVSKPSIYFLAERSPASKFFYNTQYVVYQEMQRDDLASSIAKRAARVIVVQEHRDDMSNWLYQTVKASGDYQILSLGNNTYVCLLTSDG